MAMPKCLTAAVVLLLSISGAAACDDYPDEMALAAAQRDADLAKSATAQQDPAAQVATPTSSQPAAGHRCGRSHARTAANDCQFGRRVASITAAEPRAAGFGAGGRYRSPCLLCALHSLRYLLSITAGVHAHVNDRGMDYSLYKDRVGIPCCSKEDCRPAEKFVETVENGREVVRLLIDGEWITVSRDFSWASPRPTAGRTGAASCSRPAIPRSGGRAPGASFCLRGCYSPACRSWDVGRNRLARAC